MTTLLAIETATAACSAAVWCDGHVTGRFAVIGRGHAERLLPMIREVLTDAGIAARSLDALAVTRGPGAFTGLRIGLAAARGMALALARPCFARTTLEILAADGDNGAAGAVARLVVVDSGRRDLYAQVFAATAVPLTPPTVVAYDGVTRLVGRVLPPGTAIAVAGHPQGPVVEALAAAGFAAVAEADRVWPRAERLAAVVARAWQAGEAPPPQPPSPLYLRAADTGPPIVQPLPPTPSPAAAVGRQRR
jgi:tRNA threonylcarbamoyladenosine biosynthesis protein TsaB